MKLTGTIACAEFEVEDEFNYTNPQTSASKILRSVKVLLPHGDGTKTRESFSIPDHYELPKLVTGEMYAFPIIVGVNKKKGTISYTLRRDLKPFPAPELA